MTIITDNNLKKKNKKKITATLFVTRKNIIAIYVFVLIKTTIVTHIVVTKNFPKQKMLIFKEKITSLNRLLEPGYTINNPIRIFKRIAYLIS